MEEEITDEQICELCSYMRVIELMKSNPQVLENTEMKQGYDELCGLVDEIMKSLTSEQIDIVLETHRLQLKEIEEEEANKRKRKRISKE